MCCWPPLITLREASQDLQNPLLGRFISFLKKSRKDGSSLFDRKLRSGKWKKDLPFQAFHPEDFHSCPGWLPTEFAWRELGHSGTSSLTQFLIQHSFSKILTEPSREGAIIIWMVYTCRFFKFSLFCVFVFFSLFYRLVIAFKCFLWNSCSGLAIRNNCIFFSRV